MQIPNCYLTDVEFRALEKIHFRIFKTLEEKGLAPKREPVPGTTLERISPKSYREWRKLSQQPGELFEILRRHAIARRRGFLSLQLPNHPVNLIRELRALKAARIVRRV